ATCTTGDQAPRLANGPSCGPDAGCYTPGDIGLNSQACGGNGCLLEGWDQQMHPQDRALHEYCTCQCDGPADGGAYCACPSGFACRAFAIDAPRMCVRVGDG